MPAQAGVIVRQLHSTVNVKVEITSVQVQLTSVQVELTSVQVQLTSVQVESTSVQHRCQTGSASLCISTPSFKNKKLEMGLRMTVPVHLGILSQLHIGVERQKGKRIMKRSASEDHSFHLS